MRRSLVWLTALPCMLAGSQAGHFLAYRLVYPDAHVRLRTLVQTGHGYETVLPAVLGVGAAVVAVALAAAAFDAARGRRARPLPAWAFALLPPAGFAVQECLERLLAAGIAPWHAVAAPTFLPGLALQLPFALLAFFVARVLLRAAERAGRALALPPRVALPLTLPAAAQTAADRPPRAAASTRPASRGPPLLLPA